MSTLRVIEKLVSEAEIPPKLSLVTLPSGPPRVNDDIGLCSLIADVLNCRRCSLLVADPNGGLTVVDAVGVPSSVSPGTTLPAGDGIAARAARTGKARVVSDSTGEGDSPQSLGTYISRSFLSYPFELRHGFVGVINATERATDEPFGDHDLAIVRRFSAFYRQFFTSNHSGPGQMGDPDLRRIRLSEIQAQEDERRRIARELHDDAGHRIMSAMLRLDIALDKCADPGAIRHELGEVRQLLQDCADGIHEVSFSLRPQILGDLGLGPAVRSLCKRVQASACVPITVYVGDIAPRLPEVVELAAYRIIQEALTNTIKYAKASLVTVTILQTGAHLNVIVSDDGLGFDPERPVESARPRLGLRGMRERAEMVGGSFDLQTTTGLGTSVRATLPVSEVTP
jgi:signal transduction histidine kinase